MSNKITDEDIEKAIVKLKPVFGIKPGIYLTVIYSIIILLGLFFILIYPGLKNNGSLVYVETLPGDTAVYVDNVYMGSTPAKFFVQKGESEIKIEKIYFKPVIMKKFIDGRVFGSVLFPKKLKIIHDLSLIDPEGFLKDRFKQLSSFGLIEDYYEHYQMPPLVSRTVSEFLSGTKTENNKILYDFLYSMRVNLGSPEMVLDYMKAISLADNPDSSNEETDLSIIPDYFQKEKNSEGLVLGIIKAYPVNQRKNIIESLGKIEGVHTILNSLSQKYSDIQISKKPVPVGEKIIINGMSKFIGFSSGSYLSGPPLVESTDPLLDDAILVSFPHIETVSDFYILEKEVTRKDYLLFLNENPDWEFENIDNLIENHLVTKDYLSLQDFTDGEKPVSNISWFAAKAYCEWLETKLPPNLSTYRIKLPTEAEWEAAAGFNATGTSNNIFLEFGVSAGKSTDFTRIGKAGLYDTMGNLWEWCDNWYFPADSVNGSFGLAESIYEGAEKAVRGGSWANSEKEIKVSTRGSQNPAWCTPFLGFRPVLVRK